MKINKIIEYIKRPGKILIYLDFHNIIKLPNKFLLKKKFKYILNKKCNLNAPKTFNEKMQWLKLYDRNPKYTKMVDKYEVKKYIANIIGEEYIIPTLGVWKQFEDIDFEKLPNQFVLKCTHDSESTIICKNREEIDYNLIKNKIKKAQKRNYYLLSREWPYKNVKPRIIAEKYMATDKQRELLDYKFFCFNGEPKFLYVSEGLSNHATATISFVNMNYELTEFHRKDYKPFKKLPPKPKNFEKMKELARKLSKDIPFLRVDLYEIEGKIYFGELTFYPASGYLPFEPEEYDKILGDMLELPKEK